MKRTPIGYVPLKFEIKQDTWRRWSTTNQGTHAMKRIALSTLFPVLMAAATGAFAQMPIAEGITISSVSSDLIPVLVKVNKHGDVTSVSAPIPLKASWSRLLRENISEMVTAPAMKDGKSINSQVIFMVALDTIERTDGNYDASFTAREVRAAPSGTFSWKVQDGRYSLVDYSTVRQARRFDQPSVSPPMPNISHGNQGTPPPSPSPKA
jgi:hypothetical protein